MEVDAKHVFLVSGQRLVRGAGTDATLTPGIDQHVVIAPNLQEACALLAAQYPDFRTLGSATLDDYEQAVSKIKATLKGKDTGWGLILTTSFQG